jgi:putative DNA primase/helicase
LATAYHITQWPEDEAEIAVSRCFQSWLTHRGTIDNHEKHTVLSQIKNFFEYHGDAHFSDIDSINPHTNNRAGFRKTENNLHHYYVLPEVFRNEICAGFEYRQVCKFLIEASWIKADRDGMRTLLCVYAEGVGKMNR